MLYAVYTEQTGDTQGNDFFDIFYPRYKKLQYLCGANGAMSRSSPA